MFSRQTIRKSSAGGARGAAAAVRLRSAETAASMLGAGGNAVDTAVSAAWSPESSNRWKHRLAPAIEAAYDGFDADSYFTLEALANLPALPVESLSRQALAEVPGTDVYIGGATGRRAGSAHPRNLSLGMATWR